MKTHDVSEANRKRAVRRYSWLFLLVIFDSEETEETKEAKATIERDIARNEAQ
jgi:hypothetical protein